MNGDMTFTTPDFGSNPVQYLKEVRAEMKKVQWPSRNYVVRATLMVFGVSVALGAFLGGLDYVFTVLFGMLLKS